MRLQFGLISLVVCVCMVAVKPSPLPATVSAVPSAQMELEPSLIPSPTGATTATAAAAAPKVEAKTAPAPKVQVVVRSPLSSLETARRAFPLLAPASTDETDTAAVAPAPGGPASTTAAATATATAAAEDDSDASTEATAQSLHAAPYYRAPLPAVGELVTVRVVDNADADRVGVYVSVCEYPLRHDATAEAEAEEQHFLRGLVMGSEVTRKKRLKSVRNEMVVGKEYVCVVLRVDAKKGEPFLSTQPFFHTLGLSSLFCVLAVWCVMHRTCGSVSQARECQRRAAAQRVVALHQICALDSGACVGRRARVAACVVRALWVGAVCPVGRKAGH
jgi:hypothetical protein